MGNQDSRQDRIGYPPAPDDDLELPDDWQFEIRPPDVDRNLLGLIDHIRAEALTGRVLGAAVVTVVRGPDGGRAIGHGYVRGSAPIAMLIAGSQYLAGRLVNHTE